MNARNLGIMLVVIGIVMMIYTGFNFVTSKKVVDLGPLQVNKEENHPVQWSPIIGVLLLAGGVIILSTNRVRKR